MNEIPEISKQAFDTALPRRQRERLIRGQIESGADIVALRRFVGLTQADFARALGISVHTLRNWEQGRRQPDGPGLALLRIAARHPTIIHENLATAV
jgi:DNA-binding transcriptional regulator YiaG